VKVGTSIRGRTFEFSADTKFLSEISSLVRETGRRVGLNHEQIGDLELAVDEACTNIIAHSLDRNPHSSFKISIQEFPGGVEITLTDRGKSFDVKKLKSPDQDANLDDRTNGGWGVFFIYKLMDEVEYFRDAEGVNTLKMVKKLES